MEHTQEPWRLGIGYTVIANDPVPEMPGSEHVEYYGGHLIAESVVHRNARRIVACVNACAGLSDAEVSHGLVPASRHSTVAHQRDQLLAALRRAVDEAVADDLDEWFANAKATIAEVEAGL